jgi:hypothetical protein
MGVRIVKTVAERDHRARIVIQDDGCEAAECRHRIVGRQQHAAHGKTRALFEMQVGDDEQPLLFPEQRAGEIGEKFDRANTHGLPQPDVVDGQHAQEMIRIGDVLAVVDHAAMIRKSLLSDRMGTVSVR